MPSYENDKYLISVIMPECLESISKRVFKLLDPAIKFTNGRFTSEWYKQSILQGNHQLWIAFKKKEDPDEIIIDGALVTKIEYYPFKTMLNYVLIGGENIEQWQDPMVATLNSFARNNGCNGMELIGRDGWVRFMGSRHGWKKRFSFIDCMFDE